MCVPFVQKKNKNTNKKYTKYIGLESEENVQTPSSPRGLPLPSFGDDETNDNHNESSHTNDYHATQVTETAGVEETPTDTANSMHAKNMSSLASQPEITEMLSVDSSAGMGGGFSMASVSQVNLLYLLCDFRFCFFFCFHLCFVSLFCLAI